MPASYNFYEILGISPKAEPAEIKAAFRQLAMKYHPDKNPSPDAHKQFVAINAAYSVLSDPFKRKLYDVRRQAGRVIHYKPRSAQAHHTDPEDPMEMRRRYWASPEGQKRSKELKREAEILSKAHSYLRILAIPLLIFMLLLLVERHFPKRIIDQEVSFVKYPSGGGFYKLGKYPVLVKAHYTPCLKKGDTVDVYLGRIFGLVTEVGTSTACENYTLSKFKGDKGYIITPSDGLFGRLSFLIYLIILLIVILWLDPNSETGNGAFIFAIGLSLFVFTLFAKLFL